MLSSTSLLTRINLDELIDSFGWTDQPVLSLALRLLFYRTAEAFSRELLEFDRQVGQGGFPLAARPMLQRYTTQVNVYAETNLPSGSFLVLANHPGMADALSIFLALQRPDLHVIGLNRLFLHALPNVAQRLFFVPAEPEKRIGLIRRVSAFLRSGGAILTFPAGRIEPDPDLFPDEALISLNDWSDSAGLFLRLSPETPILPVVVRGVIWPPSLRHPLLRIKRTRQEKDKLAAALQLLAHLIRGMKDIHIRVQIGRPIRLLDTNPRDSQSLHQAVLQEMRRLIQSPPTSTTPPIFTFPSDGGATKHPQ